MGVWTDHVVPRLTDASLSSPEIGELRREACAPLTGRVLELGFGTGLNVRWYPPGTTSVAAVEPSDLSWRMSERPPGTHVGAGGAAARTGGVGPGPTGSC